MPPEYYLPESGCLKRIFAFQKGAKYPLVGECLLAAPDTDSTYLIFFLYICLRFVLGSCDVLVPVTKKIKGDTE